MGDLRIIDFHSHILPCADHGSDGIKTSKKQITLMKDAGVDTAVLTPHFYPNRHSVSTFITEINSAAEELISKCGTHPKFCLGAEVLYCEGIEAMEDIEKLCIRGTNVLLLELPMTPEWNKTMLYEVKRLATRFTVVLAHIDRYTDLHSEELMSLMSAGVCAQVNTSSFSHKSDKNALSPFIEAGYVVALGSDLHGSSKKIYRRFRKAEGRLGEDYVRIMKSSAELLTNAELL